MAHVLLIGAGKSAPYLIKFLLELHQTTGVSLTIADAQIAQIESQFGAEVVRKHAQVIDIRDNEKLHALIADKDIVISLLPAMYHHLLAPHCINAGAHLLTASYVSAEMQTYHQQALERNLLFLNECGLDPGLDHLSAMQVLDKLRAQGAEITGFRSYCGGLMAPQSDNNPWHYKFTWNPRNVVLAGQGGTARYLRNGRVCYVPYHRLFIRPETIEIEGYGQFEAYPNRNSLAYVEPYGLQRAQDVLRGTLRRPGFCRDWQVLVHLGLTDDSTILHDSENMTYAQLVEAFLNGESFEVMAGLDMRKFEWLGLFEQRPIGLPNATPAAALQKLLEEKWRLDPDDRDMVVMQHQFFYTLDNKKHKLKSSLVVEGQDSVFTAMAKTVGMPLGVAAQLVLEGKIMGRGVVIPIKSEFYQPCLARLQAMGITFCEQPF